MRSRPFGKVGLPPHLASGRKLDRLHLTGVGRKQTDSLRAESATSRHPDRARYTYGQSLGSQRVSAVRLPSESYGVDMVLINVGRTCHSPIRQKLCKFASHEYGGVDRWQRGRKSLLRSFYHAPCSGTALFVLGSPSSSCIHAPFRFLPR